MRIKKIILFNFGSYENETIFNLDTLNSDKNIIIIGGENGAGKTTLFSAIRLCLYGHEAFGYVSLNHIYEKKILKLINNSAKIRGDINSKVELLFEINNGQEMDEYMLKRSWSVNKNFKIIETIVIYKNNKALNEEELLDFAIFVKQIIPPDLFDFYFFDGEKVADLFINDNQNKKLKQAFLTLCGYDTFEIMHQNFKRQLNKNKLSDEVINNYLSAKDNLVIKEQELEDLKNELQVLEIELLVLESNICKLKDDYTNKGGQYNNTWQEQYD